MQSPDLPAVRALWEQTENLGLNESDEPAALAAFLARNPGLSAVAVHDPCASQSLAPAPASSRRVHPPLRREFEAGRSIAPSSDTVVGAVLCGHDGRRGYLHHLAVAPAARGQQLGRGLVEFAVRGLQRAGIPKCNLFVFGDRDDAVAFWEHLGWQRPTWCVMQKLILDASAADCCTC